MSAGAKRPAPALGAIAEEDAENEGSRANVPSPGHSQPASGQPAAKRTRRADASTEVSGGSQVGRCVNLLKDFRPTAWLVAVCWDNVQS